MKTFSLFILILISACNFTGRNNNSPNKSNIENWQVSALGQEGHGGDAIVCFSIPTSEAIETVEWSPKTSPQPCSSGGACNNDGTSDSVGSISPSNPDSTYNSEPKSIIRLTPRGRAAIKSAKPLEQYLAERSTRTAQIINELNALASAEEAYESVISTLKSLPAAYEQIEKEHLKLGWLKENGIASEFGLRDVDDSGFLNEQEIDSTYCHELQAVVRRDSQLWYDRDIVSHFDIAGLTFMQLHEEIYAWGKSQDQINSKIGLQESHQTSSKTRRLILKLFANSNSQTLNEQIKILGFSVGHTNQGSRIPLSPGYLMDSTTCRQESTYLSGKFYFQSQVKHFDALNLLVSRYLMNDSGAALSELARNLPEALSKIIHFTLNFQGNDFDFYNELTPLVRKLEKAGACGEE